MRNGTLFFCLPFRGLGRYTSQHKVPAVNVVLEEWLEVVVLTSFNMVTLVLRNALWIGMARIFTRWFYRVLTVFKRRND